MDLPQFTFFEFYAAAPQREDGPAVEVILAQGNVAVEEGYRIFQGRELAKEPGKAVIVGDLQGQYFDLLSAPEFFFSLPRGVAGKAFLHGRFRQPLQDSPFPGGINWKTKEVFQTEKFPLFRAYPQNHAIMERINVQKPTFSLHFY